MGRKSGENAGGNFFLKEPPEFEIIDGIAYIYAQSGGASFIMSTAVHNFMAGNRRAKQCEDEWTAKQRPTGRIGKEP